MKYQSTKTYGHDLGISSAFRQWRAKSHCSHLHSYAMSFKFVFEADELDEDNWVCDFGGLKTLKQILIDNFDHKTLVASTDPEMEWYKEAHKRNIIDMIVVPETGCEKFAEYVYGLANEWFKTTRFYPRCRIISVEVAEHGANSAIYIPDNLIS